MDESESEIAERWLKWCQNAADVKITETPVPAPILPPRYKGTLYDVRVGSKKRVPDDKIYSKSPELRDKVARGNCVLKLDHLKTPHSSKYFFLIFALRKFSGGMGDEDEDSRECQNLWENYFLQPLTNASQIIVTDKANGEAAHLSIRKLIDGDGDNCPGIFYCLGSKNVHMLLRNEDDISHYKDSRYEFARTIATTFFANYQNSSSISPDQKESLAEFLTRTKYTGVMELLQPQNEHIEDLSYLGGPALKFICWTEPYGSTEHTANKNSFCSIPPNVGIDKAKSFGLDTIEYESILPDRAEYTMQKIRGELFYEGKVLYFMDKDSNVFGIIKKKTAWYIILRALREKICHFCSPKTTVSNSEITIKVNKRLAEIQKWLGFTDGYRRTWAKLGNEFAIWAVHRNKMARSDQIRSHFPQLWKQFLENHEELKKQYDELEFVISES